MNIKQIQIIMQSDLKEILRTKLQEAYDKFDKINEDIRAEIKSRLDSVGVSCLMIYDDVNNERHLFFRSKQALEIASDVIKEVKPHDWVIILHVEKKLDIDGCCFMPLPSKHICPRLKELIEAFDHQDLNEGKNEH